MLEHSQLAVVFSCEIKDVNTLVTKEHDTLMRLRSQGITDDMLEALAKGEITINTNSEEETNESKIFSAMLAAFMLATASVGGVTASAAEKTVAEEGTAETTAVDDDSSVETTETTTSEPADDSSVTTVTADDMEKFREVMSDLAEAGTTEVNTDYDGDPYYDTDGNATLIKSEQIIYNTEEMQFIAVTTKDGHVFYVLINYSAKNAEDQVFFLNKVDDYDLYALLYAGDDEDSKITPEQAHQAAEKANGRVTGSATDGETAETAEDGEDTSEPAAQAKPVPMSKNSMMLVFGALALIGVGGAGFFMMKKKNGGNKTAAKFEPEFDDETEIAEEDEDEMNFYDHQDDEE